jgi:hypothetical protein
MPFFGITCPCFAGLGQGGWQVEQLQFLTGLMIRTRAQGCAPRSHLRTVTAPPVSRFGFEVDEKMLLICFEIVHCATETSSQRYCISANGDRW